MDKTTKWEDYLHLVEVRYNNGYQTSVKLSPFEILYLRKCSTPVSWDNPVNKIMIGPDLLKEMEMKVNKVRHNLKAAQDRQKSYDELKRQHKEFGIRYHAYLRVKP